MQTEDQIDKLYFKDKLVLYSVKRGSYVKINKNLYDNIVNGGAEAEFLKKYRLSGRDEKISTQIKINTVYFPITNKCNLSCEFCSMGSGPYVSTKDDMSLEQIKTYVIPALKEMNPHKVVITGGEPFIRKDAVEIIREMSEALGRKKIMIESNGLLLQDVLISYIAPLIDSLEVSIENVMEDEKLKCHMSKVFEQLANKDVRLNFSFVISNDNKHLLEEAMHYCKLYGASFMLRYMTPAGNGKEMEDKLFLSSQDLNELHNRIADYILENEVSDSNLIGLLFPNLFVKRHCSAYGKTMSIYPNGTVYLCANLNQGCYSLGNITKTSFLKLKQNWESKLSEPKIQELLLVDHNKSCKGCEYKFFCTGICAAKRINEQESNFVDVECRMRKEAIKFMLFYYEKAASLEENINRYKQYINGQN